PLTVSARLHAQGVPARTDAGETPLWRRSARATAIGTTIGLGASGTLLLSLWQLGDSLKQSHDADRAEARRLFTEVSRGIEDLDRPCPRLAAHVGPQLLTLRNLVEGERLPKLESEGVALLVERVRTECHPGAAAAAEPNCPRPKALASLCVQLDKPVGASPLSYWHPAQDARITLAVLWQRVRREPSPTVAMAPPPAGAPLAGAPLAAVPSAASAAVSPPAPAAAFAACAADGRPLRLYVQVYDEASRGAAESLARSLERQGGAALQLAPVENVSRSSDLRQQRRPVPWPQPTLIVHHPDDLACARALAAALQGQLPAPGTGDDSVWIRESARSLPVHRGVMDLWLPPSEAVQRGGW
ncbi:MAG TPA: hypothetical protein VLU41_02965, partial [Ideonella sp.]|nr:hypothetical protein [Ideonella sp.]